MLYHLSYLSYLKKVCIHGQQIILAHQNRIKIFFFSRFQFFQNIHFFNMIFFSKISYFQYFISFQNPIFSKVHFFKTSFFLDFILYNFILSKLHFQQNFHFIRTFILSNLSFFQQPHPLQPPITPTQPPTPTHFPQKLGL